MAKTHALGIRLDPAEREALEAAATADSRSMSALGRKILSDWLRDNGWTPRAHTSRPEMVEVGRTARGHTLWRQENGAGGHVYWSDSIGGGVIIWDTCLASREELEEAFRIEDARIDAEADAAMEREI